MASTTQHVQAAPEGNGDVVKGAYWLSSTAKTFPSSHIQPSLFTHIYYASLIPNKDTFKLEPSQSLSDFISGLPVPEEGPHLKTLISIGGAATIFANMASIPATRKAFIDSAIEVARNFLFDGLDLDWELPNSPKEMEDFGHLLKEWRNAVTEEAQATGRAPLLLSAKVYYAPEISLLDLPRSYPAKIMAKKLDWINAKCYDYHSQWEPETGANAAFFDPHSDKNSNHGLHSWIKAGMPSNKIIMGLPLYGRTWELKHPNDNGIGAPTVGPGPGNGLLPYYRIKEFNQKNNALDNYHAPTVSAYSHTGKWWMGYDHGDSTKEKMKHAQGLGLGGHFVWALGQDRAWEISSAASEAWDNAGGN